MILRFVLTIGLVFGVTSEKCQDIPTENVAWQLYRRVNIVDITLYSCEIVARDEIDCEKSATLSNTPLCETDPDKQKRARRCRDLFKKTPSKSGARVSSSGTLLCYDCQTTGATFNRMSLSSSKTFAETVYDEINIFGSIQSYELEKFVDGNVYFWENQPTHNTRSKDCPNLALVNITNFTKRVIAVKEDDSEESNEEKNEKKYLVLTDKTTSYALELVKRDTSCGFVTWETKDPKLIITENIIDNPTDMSNHREFEIRRRPDYYLTQGKETYTRRLQGCIPQSKPSEENALPQSKPSERNELHDLEAKLSIVCYVVAAILCYVTMHLLISLYNVCTNISTFRSCVFLQGNANKIFFERTRNANSDKPLEHASTSTDKPKGESSRNVEENYEYITSEYNINDLYNRNGK